MSLRESLRGICLASLPILGASCLESPTREAGPERAGAAFVKPVSPSAPVSGPAPAVPTAPSPQPPGSVSPPTSQSGSSSRASPAPLAEPRPSVDSKTAEEEKLIGQLVDRADQLLDLLEAGSLDEASRELDRLAAAFSGCGAVGAVEGILRRRLRRAMAAAGTKPSKAAGSSEDKAGEGPSLSGDKREAAAIEQLEEALAKDPGNPEPSKALADLLKKVGLEHYSKGDTSRAVSCWKKALEVRPGDGETLRFLERASAVNSKL